MIKPTAAVELRSRALHRQGESGFWIVVTDIECAALAKGVVPPVVKEMAKGYLTRLVGESDQLYQARVSEKARPR